MTAPRLTIGLPHCCDYERAWHTLAAIHKTRLALKVVDRVQLLVGDNSKTIPNAELGAKHATELQKRMAELPNAKYVEFSTVAGTAPTKNEVIRQADGDFVLVLDAHCELANEVLARILAWIDANPLDDDIHHAMELHLRMVNDDGTPAVVCSHRLERFGADGNFGICAVNELALLPNAQPFKVATAGCGFFLIRKASWLGFHPEARGWGGEEHFIQERYRQAGRHAWVHPEFQYVHQYGHIEPPEYVGRDWVTKCRNVLLGYRALGYPVLASIKEAHVQPRRMNEQQWAALIKELRIVERGRGKAPLARRSAPLVELKPSNELQPGEQELLDALPCPLRTRRSGSILCNIGCPSMQSQSVTTWDCNRHGLVTLGRRRKDLKNCLGCTTRPGTKLTADPITLPDWTGLPYRRLVIGVLSAARYEHKRQAIRETWASQLPEFVDLVFLMGNPGLQAPERRGDELWLPCPDDYDHLPLKTQGLCQWAQQSFAFDRLLKCDDDTYMALDRLLETDKGDADFVGEPLHHAPEVPSGGAGYLLSPRAVAIVARDIQSHDFAEDVAVWSALKAHGIALTPTKRFSAYPTPFPAIDNGQISAHYITPERMREIHAGLHPAPVGSSNRKTFTWCRCRRRNQGSCRPEEYCSNRVQWAGEPPPGRCTERRCSARPRSCLGTTLPREARPGKNCVHRRVSKNGRASAFRSRPILEVRLWKKGLFRRGESSRNRTWSPPWKGVSRTL